MASKNLKVRVNVTQQNISKGICSDSEKCAIAKALLDTGLFKSVSVDGDEASGVRRKRDGGGTFVAELPKRASTFIGRFDEDKKSVKPFSFSLTLRPVGAF